MPQVYAFVVAWAVEIMAVTAVVAAGYAAIQASNMNNGFDSQFAQQQMVRSSNEPRRGIYGKAMVSGPLMFIGETGDDREWLYLILAVCGHRTDGCELIKLDDEVCWHEGSGLTAKYSNHVRLKYYDGTQTTADSEMVSKFTDWTSAHVGHGISYLRIAIKNDQEVFSSGIPNIKMLVRGKPVFDPRDSQQLMNDPDTWKYTDNWALCCLDYTRLESGVGATEKEIIMDSFIAAANLSDEFVEYQAGDFEKRYTMNGTWVADQTPQTIMEALLTAGAGKLVFTHGAYSLLGGAYYGPAEITLDDDGLRDDMSLTPFTERSDICNAVRGTFVDPDNFWQSVDFPPVENAYYRDIDQGEYIDHDLDLEYVISPWAAQRLAKLHLEQSRAGFTVQYPAKLGIGMQCWPGRVVRLNIPRLGINNKEFEIVDFTLMTDEGVDLVLKETAPAIFDWALGEATSTDLTPNAELPDPKQVPTPKDLVYTANDDAATFLGVLNWSAPGNNSGYRYRVGVFNGSDALIYQEDISTPQIHLPKIDTGFYTVKVWAINAFGFLSPIPAQMTIGSTAPAPVIGIDVVIGPLSLMIKPGTAAAVAQTTVFEVNGGSTNVFADAEIIGTGKEIVWADRHPNTEYFLWARTINNQGQSAWFGPVSTATNSDNSAIVGLIGNVYTSLTWFAWADDNVGTGFTTVEAIGDGKDYLGVATDKKTSVPSGNWQDYTWTKIKTEIPELFTPEEQTQLDNLMAGKLPAGDKDMLAAQDALNNPALANELLTSLALLNNGIDAESLNGETPTGAQTKASNAQAMAIAAAASDATTKANNAKAQAEANAALDALNKANAVKDFTLSSPLLKNESYYRELPDFFFENGLLNYTEMLGGPAAGAPSLAQNSVYSQVKAGEHGGNVLRVVGTKWIASVGVIPIDTNKRYKMRFKVRQHLDGTGPRLVYAGVVTLDKDLNVLTAQPGSHRYCCVAEQDIANVDGWQVFEGYITGAGNTSHNEFRVGTAYVRPMCIVNYSGGNGTADIDELSFYEVTEQGDLIAIGMETTVNAQAKADSAKSQALAAAASDATTKANAAQSAAQAYSLAKANLAETTAKAYADGKITIEETRAIADAQAKADSAKAQAIATAASDAQYKADNAFNRAIELSVSREFFYFALHYRSAVILLIPYAESGTNISESEVFGQLTFRRGGVNSSNRTERLDLSVKSAYATTDLSMTKLEISWNWQFCTCNYNGQKWLAIHSGSNVQDARVEFWGRRTMANIAGYSASDQFKVIDYYRTGEPGYGTGAINSEIYNSIVNIAGNSARNFNGTPLENINDSQAKASAAENNAISSVALGNFIANIGLISTLIADTGLFNHLKSRLGVFGGLTAETIASLAIATNHLQAGAVTADKVTVNTALIQKLIADQGLFNQLQAQLGIFGGLSANSIAAGAIQSDKLAVLAREYVNPVSITGNLVGWGGVLEDGSGGNGSVVEYDNTEKALVIKSSSNHSVWCKSWKVNHDKIYRISMKIKASAASGLYYLGVGALTYSREGGISNGGNGQGDIALHNYSTLRAYAGSSANSYFSSGVSGTEYVEHIVYLIGANRSVSDCPAHDGPAGSPFLKLDINATAASIRILNWSNTSYKKLYIKDISVIEAGAGQIVAENIVANAITADKIAANAVSAGKIAANTVTATELLADSALINKLVATSALFNSLQARLAVFGGLTANSISSDAILGRHIKAGETIESPVIIGGQYQLIGSNTMKIESETPFGPDGLIEWRGPKLILNGQPNWSQIRKSNATRWTDSIGNEYFGGSISAGILKTGVTNPDKNSYADNSYPVVIGPFGSGGKAKTVVVSFDFDASWTATSAANGATPALSWQLQRKIGSGSWATVSSGTFTGSINSTYEAEISRYLVNEFCSGSSTFTDSSTSTSDFSYQLKVISQTRYSATSNVNNQKLTVISTEQ
jgi:pyruvate/2-oxoglutarate dehydrogenase complex dihydrolipoamide acyltransferase (E2) component